MSKVIIPQIPYKGIFFGKVIWLCQIKVRALGVTPVTAGVNTKYFEVFFF